MSEHPGVRIDEAAIEAALLAGQRHDRGQVREILARATELKGLSATDVAVLTGISDPELLHDLFATARTVKELIYGNRLVIFAPLYISNLCGNECLYCAFRARNREVKRRALSQEEIAHEVEILLDQGHKRVLMVAGESYPREGFSYVLKSVETIYGVTRGHGEVRRVNVNVAPLTVDEFRQLKNAKIGTYQIFQETYHRETYSKVHLAGKKADFDWRVNAPCRAMEAGIDDVGIGVLFGLADWRFDTLALMQHIAHLEDRYGVGPHTISVPRLEPAVGSEMANHPPKPVSDVDFRKIIAILRLAVPYTGIILSTRESADMRHETFALGVSQISAGSRTNPGGYAEDEKVDEAQFCLGDHRSLDEVIRDISSMGFVPSFCTACYRLGRTGAEFMHLAKPGDIKDHCSPNAIATFQEYLEDYGTPESRAAGELLIARSLATMEPHTRARTEKMVSAVKDGTRDVYC